MASIDNTGKEPFPNPNPETIMEPFQEPETHALPAPSPAPAKNVIPHASRPVDGRPEGERD